MIKSIFFDLDGTLLPMDQEVFGRGYFKTLATFALQFGIESKAMIEGLKLSLEAMAKNDGTLSNEEAFWRSFTNHVGGSKEKLAKEFEAYYHEIFPDVVAQTCGFNPLSAQAIRILKSKNYPLYLLTNPLFPSLATQARVKHAGLNQEDFEEITTYENYHSCKPSLAYYQEVLSKYSLNPKECLMIGNDLYEDGVARELGMQVFIVTEDLINRQNRDLNKYPHGDFNELLAFLEHLPQLEMSE